MFLFCFKENKIKDKHKVVMHIMHTGPLSSSVTYIFIGLVAEAVLELSLKNLPRNAGGFILILAFRDYEILSSKNLHTYDLHHFKHS